MDRSIRVAIALSMAVAPALMSGPVLAECSSNSANPWPAFEEVAPRAREVIVGTVVETARFDPTEFSTKFIVEVEDVLKGDAPTTIEINGLLSGIPLRRKGPGACPDSSILYATLGDRIAIAFDGKVPGVKGRVNSAAWIEGRPFGVNPGLQTMSFNDIRRAAGVRPIPSFQAIVSGSSLSVDGVTIVLDGVTAVPWLSDSLSRTTGIWDLEHFVAGWDDRPDDLDPPLAIVRIADAVGPEEPGYDPRDITFEVTDITTDGDAVRLGFTTPDGTTIDGHDGPTSLFIDIQENPDTW